MTMALPAAIRFVFINPLKLQTFILNLECNLTSIVAYSTRIAHEGGNYGFVFARRGTTMESSSSFFLPRLIGFFRAMYLVTTGGVYPPNSPHLGHLFAETLPEASQVLPRALELAKEVAENVSPLALYLNHSLMWRNPGAAEETHLLDSSVLYHMFFWEVGC